MAGYAPKASGNIWFDARQKAAEFNDKLSSREGASEEIGVERTRLARIETGVSVPHTDECMMMADVYGAPELRNHYCKHLCPLGKNNPEIEDVDIDRITIKALASLRKVKGVKETLLDIVDDGIITEDEKPELEEIINVLDELNTVNQHLKVWREKNLK